MLLRVPKEPFSTDHLKTSSLYCISSLLLAAVKYSRTYHTMQCNYHNYLLLPDILSPLSVYRNTLAYRIVGLFQYYYTKYATITATTFILLLQLLAIARSAVALMCIPQYPRV